VNTTAANIYHSILLRAADEWGVEYEDVERDIGQQFDPVVRFMAGACASELERVYQHMQGVEERLQQRLARVLLPEYFHLPQPAHALATAMPADETVQIEETTAFVKETEEGGAIAFSPLWPMRLLPAAIKVAATETRLLQLQRRASLRRGAEAPEEEFSRILIGFELPEPPADWKGASLYFDWKGGSGIQTERASLLTALVQCKCLLDGRETGVFNGLPGASLLLEDYLNGNERLQNQVRTRYEPHFLTFADSEISPAEPKTAQEYLPAWFARFNNSDPDTDADPVPIEQGAGKPLHWLEIQLARPLTLPNIDAHLDLRFNVFPVVNRRLCGAGNGEHHYLQNTSIKWLHLQPEEDFVSIRRVYEEQPPEYSLFTFKPFADFREDNSPSYTLRHGGVGRWDEFNAWQRLAYVVAILQENYQHQELIQKAAASLSLEDIHHLLGKKIAETGVAQNPVRDIYVLLHSGSTGGLRARVEYWTSQGVRANGIAAKSALVCKSKLAANLENDSIELITAASGGRDPLNAPEQMDAMKSALLSRGRIVTREDVQVFCREFLRDKLAGLSVRDGVGTDPRFDFGMTRVLDVHLQPAAAAEKEDWDGICRQLKRLLEQRSSSSIPIRVGLAFE
jgi:hypothetical protein